MLLLLLYIIYKIIYNHKRIRQAINNSIKYRVDPFGKVLNLSKLNFSVYEFQLLGHNLNFIPTPKSFDKNNLNRDVYQFNRRIKLRSHFGNTPGTTEKTFKKSNSIWEPKDVHHTVKTFIEDFTRKLNNSLEEQKETDNKQYKNLNKHEEKALQDLMERNEILICNADKGGIVAIMDVKDYIQEAERQLSDNNFYKKLLTNPTSLHAELVNNAIEQLRNRNLINEKVAQGLKVSNPRTPLSYLLPKIHKINYPGRPVVSSINCHTESISQFVDYHLQPLAKKLPSYIQDTTDFLRKLNELPKHLPKDSILVTMDVKSLYTNIPNDEGIEAVKTYLRESDKKSLTPVISVFLTLTYLRESDKKSLTPVISAFLTLTYLR